MIKGRKVYDPLTDTWSTGYWVVDDKGNYYPVWQKGAVMERLTYRTELGVSIDKNEECPTCSICWNCDIPPRECQYISDALEKLAKYEDLEEQGRLIKLPCKVGDTVYHVVQGRIVEVSNVDLFFLLLSVAENRFNNSVFLTKSEAEAKLKELRGGENER